MILNLNKPMIVKPSEINKVIEDYNLRIYKNIWHYSYNSKYQLLNFKFEDRKDGTKILYSKSRNIFAPLLIYTNSDSEILLKEDNAIQNPVDQENLLYRHAFWFLKVDTFNAFLERRSKYSSKPKKHFPSVESYEKYRSKINGGVRFQDFDESFFTKSYNNLKLPNYLSGEEILALFKRNNPDIKYKLFRLAVLSHDNEVVAVALLVDDGKSINLENIAAKRDAISFGVFLCTEIIKFCSENSYYSFDAGVSGLSGYKLKIFLDSKEVFKKQNNDSLKYFRFWKKSYWKKLKQKTSNIIDK